jgi:hypothetical protein
MERSFSASGIAVRRPGSVFAVAAALLLAVTSAAAAQTATAAPVSAVSTGRSWTKVEALQPGKKLRITTTAMSHVNCIFNSADDASITCGQVTIPRAEIKSIKLSRRGLSAGVGVATGLVAGILLEAEAFNIGWNGKASEGVVAAVAIVGVAALVGIPIFAIIYDWCGQTIYTAN